MFRRSTSVSRGSSSGEAPIQTALTQRYSAILAAYLLDHQPLETQVDLRQTPNQPLETRDGRISTKTNEKTLCGGMNAEGLVEKFQRKQMKRPLPDGSRNRDLFDANEALYQLSYSPLDVTLLRKATRNNIVRSTVKRNLTPKCRTRVDTVTFRCRRRGKSPTPLRMDTAAAPGNVITSPARPAPSFRCRTRTRCRPDRTARPRTRRRCGSPRRTPCRWWRRR